MARRELEKAVSIPSQYSHLIRETKLHKPNKQVVKELNSDPMEVSSSNSRY